jgi:hypothetical protein
MRPIKVTSPVAPSKAIIHQVKTKRPIPHNNPQVSAKAFTLSFMILLLSSALYHKFQYEKTATSHPRSDGPFLQDDIGVAFCQGFVGVNPLRSDHGDAQWYFS